MRLLDSRRAIGTLLLAAVALATVALAQVAGCTALRSPQDMNLLAERYVKLVLQVGQHDGDFVDAYYGNPAWKPTGAPVALAELTQTASALRRQICGRGAAVRRRRTDPAASRLSRQTDGRG